MLFVYSCTEPYLPTVMVWHVYSLWWGGLSDFCVGLYRGARIYPPPPSPQMLQSSCGTRRKLCILNMHKLTLCFSPGTEEARSYMCFLTVFQIQKKNVLLSQTHVIYTMFYRIFQQILNTISSIVFFSHNMHYSDIHEFIFMHAWALSCSKA